MVTTMDNIARITTGRTHYKKGKTSACHKGQGNSPAQRELTTYIDEVTCAKCIAIIDKQFEAGGDVKPLI